MKLTNKFRVLRKQEGFTLVELIVVIAIIAVLAGVGVPAYSGYIEKTNKQADLTLAGEVANALQLYYYSHPGTAGGSVTLSTSGADAAPAELGAAMEAVFGENWKETCKLKYDGWTNSHEDIKVSVNNSNFSDGNGGVNMKLLGAVDNLTGQLSKVMDGGALKLQNFPGYTQFLIDNGIDPADTSLAANAAVLYLSQSSMPQENRDAVAAMLADRNTWDAGGTFNLADSFMGPLATQGTCTQFESLAMVYATMQGYCMQKDKENEDTAWSDRFAAIDLTTMADGNPVFDENQVLNKLCGEFAEMVDEDDPELFYEYLENNAGKDIDAYYGVIDGISENQGTFMEKLNGSDNFYSSQQGLLENYWNLNLTSGNAAVSLREENGVPMTEIFGMGG